MQFVFDEEKAAQAAAHLIRLHGGRMNYTALLKLLYLADRQALVETGYPITGDRMVSMRLGPVLSGIYDQIKTSRKNAPPGSAWHKWISDPVGYEVTTRDEPPDNRLSRYEIATLEDIHGHFGEMDWRALSKRTHKLPEWENPGLSSRPIEAARILEDAGKTAKEIEGMRANARRMRHAHRILGAGI